MAKPPVAFPGLTPAAWDQFARNVARAASADLERLTAGSTVRRGTDARLRALVESLRQLRGLSTDEAWVAARAVGATSQQLADALNQVLGTVPPSIAQTVTESARWVAAGGVPTILNEGAVAQIVARTQAAITADWTRLATAAQDGIVTTLQQAVTGGLGARDAATAMYQGLYGQTGLTHARALTIARTELADAYQTANLQTYQQAGITHYQWFAQIGSPRTCAMCLTLHGSVYEIGTEPPEQHHNCRCEMLPVFPDELDSVVDGRMPGTKVPNDTIQDRLPKSWDRLPDDPRTLILSKPTPGWRGVKTWQRPTSLPGGVTSADVRAAQEALFDPEELAFYKRMADNIGDTTNLDAALAKKQYQAMRASYEGAMPDDLRDVLDTGYFGNDNSFLINQALRNGDTLDDTVQQMQAASRTWATPDPVAVHRGMWDMDDLPDDLTGSLWQDKAFQSATFDRGRAITWAQSRGDNVVIMDILAPRGTRMAIGSPADGQMEALIPDGATLRVVSDTIETLSGSKVRVLKCVVETV